MSRTSTRVPFLTLRALVAASVGTALAVRALRGGSVSFQGKTVLITGGSRGLGLELARVFAAEGARLALCARDRTALERARRELEAEGVEVLADTCDVTDQTEVEAFVGRVHERFGAVDVLVNNAGIIQAGPIESMTLEDFKAALDTHVWGSLYTTLAVLPEMKRRGEGRIVNIASVGGKVSLPHLVPYSTSKFALVGLSDGMRAELAQAGIRVTTVCPGLMRTGSPRNSDFKGDAEAEYAWFLVSDSMPGLAMSSRRAARKIVAACRRGDAEAVLTVSAKVIAAARALAPNLTIGLLGLFSRALPKGSDPTPHKGRDVETRLTRSWLTGLTREAERRNNEVTPQVVH